MQTSMRIILSWLTWLALRSVCHADMDSLNVELLYHWEDTTLPGSFAYNNTYNEIWAVNWNGREYAIIGSTMGTHVFDITDAPDVESTGFIPAPFANPYVVHRDYHDYRGYLYAVCDEGTGLSELQIINLNYLPDSLPVVYSGKDLFSTAHNIFIDTATGKLYACGVRDSNGIPYAMQVYSLADPIHPQLLGTFSGASYVHDVYVRNDTAFCNAGNEGLIVVDFSDAANPVTLGVLNFYPYKGYNHSGWLNRAGNTYVMCDENHGYPVKVCDVSDLSDIRVVSIFQPGSDTNSIPHNAMIKDKYVYLSYYYDGLQIYDISHPELPELAGFYDTYPGDNNLSYEGAWGVFPYLKDNKVLISDMQTGLYVFRFSPPNYTSSESQKPGKSPALSILPDGTLKFSNLPESCQRCLISIHDETGRLLHEQRVQSEKGEQSIRLSQRLTPGTKPVIITLQSRNASFSWLKVLTSE